MNKDVTGGINNVIVVSDLHCGCRVGLCPPTARLDGGGIYHAGPIQTQSWKWWQEFWGEWVPTVTRGEPFAVVVNGDAIDGRHHGATTQVSQNLADQENIAAEILAHIRIRCDGRLYMIKGTEIHVGTSAEDEERLARRVGAIPDRQGHHSRGALWMQVGKALVHYAHHIGATSRAAYESSALMGEFTEMLTEAAKQRLAPPDIVVRSHRHRHIKVEVPTENTYGIIFTTPSWQGPTPWLLRTLGGRAQLPQFGGALIRSGDEEIYTRHFTRTLPRDETEVV